MKLAVVGGGWAGIAAAVRASEAGHAVTLYEMAPHWGGRARAVEVEGQVLDNGQHILIGAYRQSLALMRRVGVRPDTVLHRQALELRYPDGRGLRLARGPAALGFGIGVLRAQGWTWADKIALLSAAAGWARTGFRCEPGMTVDTLCAGLPAAVRQLLIDPLCVAALNTPAAQASAAVLLRVLRDALFEGGGGADLLLPRQTLSELLPEPAAAWLQARGAVLRPGTRVQSLRPVGPAWQLDGAAHDQVVLACSAVEAARLCADIAPAWARRAQALHHEPIVTVYLHCPGARLPRPMMTLTDGPQAPAQFAFDLGRIGGREGLFAFVVSGAARWVEAGQAVTAAAVRRQAQQAFAPGTWPEPPTIVQTLSEKRATFRCTPALDRPPAIIAPGLVAAGDYVEGPYPATLEGAVRSGEAAAATLTQPGRA